MSQILQVFIEYDVRSGMNRITERTMESVKQDQISRMCRVIWLYAFRWNTQDRKP